MIKPEYHVHVNGFEVGEDTIGVFLSSGMYHDPFDRADGKAPPHHYTLKTLNAHERDVAFSDAATAAEHDPVFRGYIEAETCAPNHRKVYQARPFSGGTAFPWEPFFMAPVLVGEKKAADLHIERVGPRDELDELLLARDFFEIAWYNPGTEETERVFTLHTATVRDADAARLLLHDYFTQVGGIQAMDLEITGAFYRKPDDFEVPPVLPAGALY